MSFFRSITRSFKHFLELIYPPLCFSCNEMLLRGENVVCTRCKLDLPVLSNQEVLQGIRDKLIDVSPQYLSCFLYYKKGNITQELLHAFKYSGYETLGLHLGRWFGDFILSEVKNQKIDIIIPVPLHRSKLRKRGFNQSAVIAKGISEITRMPYYDKVVIRVSRNKSQTTKSRFSRMLDVREIFKVKDQSAIAGKHILLIDDVITTGSTIASCATVLMKAGAGRISIAALAAAQ